jgi:AcrR family transcriptional regulator
MSTLELVAAPVKRRRYTSALRAERAHQTRHQVLETARALFAAQGYGATTVAGIADRAGVAIDTVYSAVGPKPVLFRLLLETAISGTDEAVPADERAYVRRIKAATGAAAKMELYALAVRVIGERLAPLYGVLAEAAPQVPELAVMRAEISARRAANMRRFAAELLSTGDLRPGTDVDEIGDVVWSTSSPEMYALLVIGRGWSPERFERWLSDTWAKLFLA